MLEVQGGGNCGNALTAVARLGCRARILSMIGDDANGRSIVSEFNADGVDTEHLQTQPGCPTPFTYIIVDRTGGTRTCIHTPGAALRAQDISGDLCQQMLHGVALVYFDGRLTEAALVVAQAARAAGVPVLVEAERLRPNLELLMAEADYLVTSAHFPKDWTGEDNAGDAMLATALRLPNIKWMVTTFGKKGAVLLDIHRSEHGKHAQLQATINSAFAELEAVNTQSPAAPAASATVACVAGNGVSVHAGHVVTMPGPLQLTFNRETINTKEALQKALAASAAEAAANGQDGQGEAYMSLLDLNDNESSEEDKSLCATVYASSGATLQAEDVVDTTGAGDAFIGSLLYGITTGQTFEQMLKLASVVAACKCTMLGARPGLPGREAIAAELLVGCEPTR